MFASYLGSPLPRRRNNTVVGEAIAGVTAAAGDLLHCSFFQRSVSVIQIKKRSAGSRPHSAISLERALPPTQNPIAEIRVAQLLSAPRVPPH